MQAYHRGLFGEEYVYMTIGGFQSGWWRLSTNSSCLPELLEAVIINGFYFIPEGYLLKTDGSDPAISGMVSIMNLLNIIITYIVNPF